MVTAHDRFGRRLRLMGSGLMAKALQHEIDHLDGVLYIDQGLRHRAGRGGSEDHDERRELGIARCVHGQFPEFAVPTLRRLVEDGHDIVCVFTQPDRAAGRGRKISPPPVKTAALELGLAVEQPPRVSAPGVVEAIRRMSPDVAVVAAFGQKISPELLSVPKNGFVNVHLRSFQDTEGLHPWKGAS